MISETQLPLKVSLDISFDAPDGEAYFILDNEGRPLVEIYETKEPGHEEALANLICKLLNERFAKPSEPEGESYICLHPWFLNEDGSQEHSDDRSKIDGWNVFSRRPCKVDGFKVLDDQDFATYEEALAEAQRRAAITGFEIDEY